VRMSLSHLRLRCLRVAFHPPKRRSSSINGALKP
jgi:hypothetical protein